MAKAKAKPAPTQKGAPAATTTMKAAQPQKDPVVLSVREHSTMSQQSQSVPSLRAELTEVFRQALDKAYPHANIEPVVAQTNEPKFGDYQCNNAMALFGKLKGQVIAVLSQNGVYESTTKHMFAERVTIISLDR